MEAAANKLTSVSAAVDVGLTLASGLLDRDFMTRGEFADLDRDFTTHVCPDNSHSLLSNLALLWLRLQA